MDDDSLRKLYKIMAPTLIVWGDRDAILPQSDQEFLAAAITGSRILVYPGAGHAFYWEDPGRVASDLAAFIAELETVNYPSRSEGRSKRMSVERNKDTFRRYVEEVWKDEQLDIADEVFADKYLSTSPTAPPWSAAQKTSRSSSWSTAPLSRTSKTSSRT